MQDILYGSAKFVGPNKVKYGFPGRVDVGGEVTAKDIIIATGSVPFVPPGAVWNQAYRHKTKHVQQYTCMRVQTRL